MRAFRRSPAETGLTRSDGNCGTAAINGYGHRSMTGKSLKGYRIKNGKVEKIKAYGLDAAARIRQKKSKKTKPIKRVP